MSAAFFPEFLGTIAAIAAAWGGGELALCRKRNRNFLQSFCIGIILIAAGAILLPELPREIAAWSLAAYGVFAAGWKLQKKQIHPRKTWFFLLLLMLIFLPIALLPPYTWDEQVYQTALLERFFRSGTVWGFKDNPYAAYPLLPQLYLLPFYRVGGIYLPKLMTWTLTLIALYVLWSQLQLPDKILKTILWTAIFLSPLTFIMSRVFQAEIWLVLFALCGAELLQSPHFGKGEAAVLGALIGGAVSVKLTGGAVSVLLLTGALQDRDKRGLILPLLLAAASTASPFFLRIAAVYGWPCYPFGASLFLPSEAPACGVEKFFVAIGNRYGGSLPAGICFGWLWCAVNGELYDGVTAGLQFPLLFLLLMAGAIMFRGKNPAGAAGRSWLWWTAGYLFWGMTSRQTRFLYPLLWLLPLAIQPYLMQISAKITKIVTVLLLLTVTGSIAISFIHYCEPIIAWKMLHQARKFPAEFAAGNDREYADLLTNVNLMPATAGVASLFERRTLYFRPEVTVVTPGFQELLTPIPDRGILWERLKNYEAILISLPAGDVDAAVGEIANGEKLAAEIMELVAAGKLRFAAPGILTPVRAPVSNCPAR